MLNKPCRSSCKTCNTCNMQLATRPVTTTGGGVLVLGRYGAVVEQWNGVSFHTDERTNFRGHNFN